MSHSGPTKESEFSPVAESPAIAIQFNRKKRKYSKKDLLAIGESPECKEWPYDFDRKDVPEGLKNVLLSRVPAEEEENKNVSPNLNAKKSPL